MAGPEETVCKYNQNGSWKYRQNCKKKHDNEICEEKKGMWQQHMHKIAPNWMQKIQKYHLV